MRYFSILLAYSGGNFVVSASGHESRISNNTGRSAEVARYPTVSILTEDLSWRASDTEHRQFYANYIAVGNDTHRGVEVRLICSFNVSRNVPEQFRESMKSP